MRARPALVVFALSLTLYLAIGFVLALHYNFLMGDALSRVQSAQGVLFSRNPHLAEIGFIFTPLTALVEIPLVALSPWIPELTRYGLAGVIMSALFMAAAAAQIWGIGADRGTPHWQRVAVTAVFVVNPMIVFYGATGMSEAPFVFLMCWATRRLIRWTSTDDVHDLIGAGVALGLAYLTRYDAVVPIAAAAVFVAVRTCRRSGAARRDRLREGFLDAVILVAPGALAVFVWAYSSWLLTGHVLAQISSSYGNTQILAQSGGPIDSGWSTLGFSTAETLLLAPALPLVVPAVVALAVRRRDLEVLVPTLLFGSVLAFQSFSYARGITFPFLRFYIIVIPLICVYALQLSPARGVLPSRRPGRYASVRNISEPDVRWAAVAGTALLVFGLPITLVGMADPQLSAQQYALRSIVAGPNDNAEQDTRERRILATFSTERAIADHLDAMDLPEGSVLMDTVSGFAIVAASDNPRQFVVPSDDDFVSVLGEPAEHGVQYILAVPGAGRGASDAVNRRYPTLFDTGGEVATLDLEIPNDGADQPDWRLYRALTDTPQP